MADLKKMDTTEIQKNVADKREELRSMRFGAAGSRSRNVRGGRAIKREIAQMLTELRAREIAAEKKTA
jgi:ribosomal protein L29